MKWIGQHVWSFISRFRSDVYLESVDSGTIASGGNLGLDSNNKVVKQADTGVTDLHGAGVDGADNNMLTDKGDGTITSESTLTYNSDIGILNLDNSGLSAFQINNSSATTVPGHLYLQNKRGGGAGSSSDQCGKIVFEGQNSNSETIGFAAIIADIENVGDTDEAGKLYIQVAASNGSTSTPKGALVATGHGTDNRVDVVIGYNTTSVTTIAGDLDIDGDTITSAGDLTFDCPGDIHIDAAGGDIHFKDNGSLLDTINSDGFSGQSKSAGTLSWNGTSCKVFPNEFMVDDGGGTWRVFETAGGVYSGKFSDTSTEAICYFRIPDGKKVTRVIFNTTTTATNVCSVRPFNYTTGQAGSEETFNSNTLANLSAQIAGALTTDLLLTFKPASSTTGLYGVLITMIDV
tara:strand:- start:566 stop:1777 length:1212 start_codon:yes stop_codon:yes gene_type:complete